MSVVQLAPLMQRRPKLLSPFSVSPASLKARQRSRIAEIRIALVEAGVVTLNEQVTALGLSRSTACSVLKPGHKSSGLEARTVIRILQSPPLPGPARQRTFEYVQEKIEGLYGHTKRRRREFAECLSTALPSEFKLAVGGQENESWSPSDRAATHVTQPGGRRTEV